VTVPAAPLACRPGCGACCIAPSISSPIPGMPGGKPAGVRCVQLTADHRCALYGLPERPPVCRDLRPSEEMCGPGPAEAMAWLGALEESTRPHELAFRYRNRAEIERQLRARPAGVRSAGS